MAIRKLEDKNIRKILKSGDSYAVTIPIEMINKLKWKEKQKIVHKMRYIGGRFKVLLHHFVNIWQPPHSELDNSMIFLDDYSVSLVSRKSPHLTL